MKKIITVIILMTVSFSMYSQVMIDKKVGDPNSILDFENSIGGIILPRVEGGEPVSAVAGTIIYDVDSKNIKYKNSATTWIDLTEVGVGDGTTTEYLELESAKTTGVVISDNTLATAVTTPGVLVLESTDKAMMLPKMSSPHLNMISPEAGTMVYDTDSGLLCVFDGGKWYFWGK